MLLLALFSTTIHKNQLEIINMSKEIKKHIKLYASDEHIELIKQRAINEGLSQSSYLFLLTKKDLKKADK